MSPKIEQLQILKDKIQRLEQQIKFEEENVEMISKELDVECKVDDDGNYQFSNKNGIKFYIAHYDGIGLYAKSESIPVFAIEEYFDLDIKTFIQMLKMVWHIIEEQYD